MREILSVSKEELKKRLTATWMLTNRQNGASSCEIAREVKVTQKSALVHAATGSPCDAGCQIAI
jgi:hypothetical protein